VPANEFVEVALVALRRLLLNHQRQILLVEFFAPLLSSNVLQRLAATVAGEIDTDHPHIILPTGGFHPRRMSLDVP
jgi:hypothetical protein